MLRNHETEQPFMGPRFLVRTAGLEMHPIDQADRRGYLKDVGGIGYCNITKCCTEVCPEHIKITDNAIIPLKERVADEYYDPIRMVWRSSAFGRAGSPRAVAQPVVDAPGGRSGADRAPSGQVPAPAPAEGKTVRDPHGRRRPRQPRTGIPGRAAHRRRRARTR